MNQQEVRTPKVSVVTVVRNGESTLRETIASVLERLGTVGEYLIVDGASTDRTLDIIESFRDRLAYFVSEPDRGIYDAMNKAMRAARGDWVIFIGADDLLRVKLDDITCEMSDPEAVYYGDVTIANSGARYAGRFSKYKLMQQNICHQSIFYPRVAYRNKRYEMDVGPLADHKYNIELWGSGVPFKRLDRIVSIFNDQGVSNNAHRAFEELKMKTIKNSFGPFYYNVKCVRSILVKVLKGKREPA